MDYNITIEVDANDSGIRIDKLVSDKCPEVSRSRVKELLDNEGITVNGKRVKASYKATEGDVILVAVPEPEAYEALPEDIPLDILYEDEDVLVVNKPKDMVVHPAAGHFSGTLVNAIMFHCGDSLSGINGVLRPGIVHRIDKDTSGILVVAKNDTAHNSLAEQFHEHSIVREYSAIVHGNFNEGIYTEYHMVDGIFKKTVEKASDDGSTSGLIDAPIGRDEKNRLRNDINVKNGKNAVTHFTLKENFSAFAYVKCRLETGRTHQIRVHMSHINHPLLGDTLYGGKEKFKQEVLMGQCLHAGLLGFNHPRTGEYMEFEAKLPDYFTKILEALR